MRPSPASSKHSSQSGRNKNWSTISFINVQFHYPVDPSNYQLGPVDFELHKGETVFLTGVNGSGKTTLLLLLCGLLQPSDGEIAIDGRQINHEIDDYHERFSGVFGEIYLFPEILDQNGTLVADDKILQLLKIVQLEHKVVAESSRWSTSDLSAGQRKRLAFVQCCAEDRDICFFDEWAADQDPIFRHYFYNTLLPNLKKQGKTLVVISHDDRYFHTADRVVELKAGRLTAVPVGQSATGGQVSMHGNVRDKQTLIT